MNTPIRQTDSEARERALDPSCSFAVQAPAGSGKTELLMQRYLGLLALVERPEEILALTFTRKAAGEMRSRVIGAMQKAASGHVPAAEHEAKTIALAKKALERDSALGWSLLENPNRLKVVTIDSFCASIVRQMPVLSGLGRYSIVDEPDEFYKEAAERTASLVEEEGSRGDALRKALGHLGNSVKGLVDRLVMMLARRDQWLRHIRRGAAGPELRGLLEGSLQRLVESELDRISKTFPPGIAGIIAPYANYAASNIEKPQCPIASLADLDGLPPSEASALAQWQGLRELLLTKEQCLRKQVNINTGFPAGKGDAADRKREFQELLTSFDKFTDLIKAIGRVSLLPEPKFTEDEWEALEAIISLLPIAEEMLTESFGANALVDFQGVSLAALKALGTEEAPTDLMLSLDLKVQHILVDEYQDTSHTQLSLLEALTAGWSDGDGRTLFVVGDPMQSIYLFREAEVGLFLDARREGIGAVRMAPLTLSRNFRSEEGIVSWVNGTLSGAFQQSEDPFTGAVEYSPSEAVRERAGGRVEINLFNGRDDHAEAQKVISILKSIPPDETTAILCRSRGNLAAILEALKKESIPFGAQAIDPLSGRMVVQDIMSLLRALSHPLDRVAWLSCLRAPWCALSASDLLAMCSGDREGPVWGLLNDGARMATLSEEGRTRARSFSVEMDKALGVWGRQSPSQVLRGLWISLGGPACSDESGRDDASRLFSLVEGVEASGAVSVEEVASRLARLYSDHLGSSKGKLNLMTIHKAKGLEFDNVIIPGMGKESRGEDKKLLVWMERGEEDLLLAPIERKDAKEGSRIYSYLSAIQKEKASNEEARLLYVAATRARKSLFLSGHIRENEDGEIKTRPRSFFSRIPDALIMEGAAGERPDEEAGEKMVLRLKRLPSSWALPEAREALASVGEFTAPAKEGPVFYWAGEAAKYLGTVVHRYFCAISKEGLEKWDSARIGKEEPRMRSMLKSFGLSSIEAAKASKEGVAILKKALEDEKGRWVLAAHDEASSELPLTAVINGEIERVVIDRTFVDASGVRWVIDFKTGVHAGGSLEEFLKNELERYSGQLLKYQMALKAYGETRPIRKGLYYPAHRAWVEA